MPDERSDNTRLKVLVSAYACEPNQGSEPGMAWNWVSHLASYHDLWIITEENRFAPALREHLFIRPDLANHINIIGVNRQRYGENIWSHFFYYTYMLWQRGAYNAAVRLHEEVKFDLVHQLNMIGYREPGYLWRLPIPFIWGPIGGHAQMPWPFMHSLGWKGVLHYSLRNVLNLIQMRTSLRVRLAMQKANILIAATSADQEAIRRIHGRRAILLNETGSDTSAIRSINKTIWDGQRPLRLVWCGQFLARKALPLALYSLSRLKNNLLIELNIIGSGVCEVEWKQLARQLDLNNLIIWHGKLAHNKVLEIMHDGDVMLFTSLQGTPHVVLEALSQGLPVICHDNCGHGTTINDSCGIKIPVQSPQKSIEGFTNALLRIAKELTLLPILSEGALRTSRELSWENKAKTMISLYERATNAAKL
jgi:glycosyltransferase involved in cell wall biosynthesis